MSSFEIDKMRFAFEGNPEKISIILLAACIILVFCIKNSKEFVAKFKPTSLNFLITIILFITSILSLNKFSEFLYFQF